jgi:hypothetical protein
MNSKTSEYTGHTGQAMLLNQDSQSLSTGVVFFDISGLSGKYEPSKPYQYTSDNPPAFLVLLPERASYRLSYFESQCAAGRPHFHFKVQLWYRVIVGRAVFFKNAG